jgi:hypothetical protein
MACGLLHSVVSRRFDFPVPLRPSLHWILPAFARPWLPRGTDWRNTLSRLTFAKLLAAGVCFAALAASGETVLNAKTSWIGNTFGFGDGTWTQINITAIAVAPDGKVYSNAPWDESGAEASTYQNGKMLGFAGGAEPPLSVCRDRGRQ